MLSVVDAVWWHLCVIHSQTIDWRGLKWSLKLGTLKSHEVLEKKKEISFIVFC